MRFSDDVVLISSEITVEVEKMINEININIGLRININ